MFEPSPLVVNVKGNYSEEFKHFAEMTASAFQNFQSVPCPLHISPCAGRQIQLTCNCQSTSDNKPRVALVATSVGRRESVRCNTHITSGPCDDDWTFRQLPARRQRTSWQKTRLVHVAVNDECFTPRYRYFYICIYAYTVHVPGSDLETAIWCWWHKVK